MEHFSRKSWWVNTEYNFSFVLCTKLLIIFPISDNDNVRSPVVGQMDIEKIVLASFSLSNSKWRFSLFWLNFAWI